MIKKHRNVLLSLLVAAMMVVVASCGGGSSTISSSSTTTIGGTITDADVDGAAVKIISSKKLITDPDRVLGTATSTAAGVFTVTGIDLSKYDSDDVFFVIADGGTVNDENVSFLKFKSIIGSQAEIDALDGDGVVDAAEVPDLTVSNVSTAKVALVEAAKNIEFDDDVSITTIATFSDITDSEAEQEKENLGLIIKLAGNIKAAVDNASNTTYTGELGLKDIAEYIKDAITVTNGVMGIDDTKMDNDLETKGLELEPQILADEDLMQSAVGGSATTVSSSSAAGTWYGYHVDTWGNEEYMGGPELVNATLSVPTSGDCSVNMVISDIVGTVCGTISGNVLKFSFATEGPEGAQGFKIEAMGTLDIAGAIMDGSYTMKDSAGNSYGGGIFKMGKEGTTDYTGTYTFAGEYSSIYVSDAAQSYITKGETGQLTNGTLTIASDGSVTGSLSEVGEEGTLTITGEIEGPRVKAKLTKTGDDMTVFIVFLIGDTEVTGLYMDFNQAVTSPDDMMDQVFSGGKFKFTEWTQS